MVNFILSSDMVNTLSWGTKFIKFDNKDHIWPRIEGNYLPNEAYEKYKEECNKGNGSGIAIYCFAKSSF